MNQRRSFVLFVTTVLLVLFCGTAAKLRAQEFRALITGQATDPSGAANPGANCGVVSTAPTAGTT